MIYEKANKVFRCFLCFSFLATFAIYLLLITSHLFYGRTYLLDTGFWIGLSTGDNAAQLIEPSGINGDVASYFNTHYSSIYSVLQIVYMPFKDLILPAGYFLIWFTTFQLLASGMFALVLSLAIDRVMPPSLPSQKIGSMLVATALCGSYWLAAGSNAHITSYAYYPHTEIIGLQLSYVGLFMLVMCIFRPPHLVCRPSHGKLMTTGGLLLIAVGSLFHELVALISIFNLTVILLADRRTCLRSNPGRVWINRGIQFVIGIISLPLLGWVLLRWQGYFTGPLSSSIKRIYVGNHFDHLSFERYAFALKGAFAENTSAALVLIIAAGISSYLSTKGQIQFCLYLLVPVIYLFVSPVAVNGTAATLTAHYGYPMISVFYLFAISLAVAESCFRQSVDLIGLNYVQVLLALPLMGAILLAAHSVQTLLSTSINIPDHCTPASVPQQAQHDTCIKQPRMGKVWFQPNFVFNYVVLGFRILRQADNTLSKLGHGGGKVNNMMSDEQLSALYPNRFRRDHVLATEEQFDFYRKNVIPPNSFFVRYNITDSLYAKDILPLLAKNGFHLVAKTRVGAFGRGVVYEYIWANSSDGLMVN